MPQLVSVGRTVHYRSYGTPGGEYSAQCRAAIVTQIDATNSDVIGLAVLNPAGLFFNEETPYDADASTGGTWHWPERV